MAGFGNGHSRNAHNTARGANPDNLDIKPAGFPAIAGTNWFPLKTLDMPNSDRMGHILMILHNGENSKSPVVGEFSAVKDREGVMISVLPPDEQGCDCGATSRTRPSSDYS
jgi:hypothetical protein